MLRFYRQIHYWHPRSVGYLQVPRCCPSQPCRRIRRDGCASEPCSIYRTIETGSHRGDRGEWREQAILLYAATISCSEPQYIISDKIFSYSVRRIRHCPTKLGSQYQRPRRLPSRRFQPRSSKVTNCGGAEDCKWKWKRTRYCWSKHWAWGTKFPSVFFEMTNKVGFGKPASRLEVESCPWLR